MLVIRDLVKTYSSGVQALKGVSLELHRRTLVFIQAFEWLDKAVVDRCAPVTYIKVWPFSIASALIRDTKTWSSAWACRCRRVEHQKGKRIPLSFSFSKRAAEKL